MNAPVAKTCRQRRLFARFASVCALVALALLLLPAAAHADGYSMTQTYIGATVEADGSLTVVEGRQFDFDDDINGVFWEINTGTNQQGGTAGVDVLSVEEEDTAFNKVDSANKGDSGVYTVEQTGDGVRIKVFSPHESGDSAIYYVSYIMTGAVMNWADTAELYWKFVGDGWSADSDDVEMEVYFANAAAGTAAVKGDNFRAWGHGPLTGDVSLDADEPMVTYTIPCVHQGEFAEARIAFPSDWVPQLAASGEERMSTILGEEKEWADEANARRAHARMISNALAVLSVVAAVAFTGTIVVLKLRRRKPKPLFQDEYFRDVPSADHPAVLSALMSWNEVPDQAYIATLMKLTDDRVIKLEQATVTKAKKGLLGREKEEQTYRVTVSDAGWKSAKGIDRMVLKVFFAGAKPDENGDRSRTFDELQHYVKQHATPVGDKLEDYQNTVKGKLADSEYVASDGIVAMVFCLVLGILIACVPAGSIFFTDGAHANIVAAVISVPIVLVGIGVGLTFRRFTPEGAEVAARCKALKHWLEDFTRLKEAVPGDLVLWNKLLVMGAALGVSKEVLRQLAEAVPPEVREADGFYDNYPCYWWYYHHYGIDSPLDSFNDVYHESIRELASSSDSSGGGGGGGGAVAPTTYDIVIPSALANIVKADKTKAAAGDTVTLTAAGEGTLTVTDANGKSVALTDLGSGKYTFKMPSAKVSVGFKTTADQPCDGGKDCPSAPFTDVDTAKWYHLSVDYVLTHKMMNGVSSRAFAPNANLTRGMLVQILYNLEGKPKGTAANFSDVQADAWYAEAVGWAAANKVVTGYADGTFRPNDAVTREQAAAILYRYAQSKGIDVSVGENTNILSYVDVQQASEYAIPALQWAVGAGVLNGKNGGRLAPTGTATRAEIAAIMQRWCENIIKK